MKERVLIDTGPIVAIASPQDSYHQLCLEQISLLQPPLFTCWPVLTEAAWLLREQTRALEAVFSGFDAGLFTLLPIDQESLPFIRTFLKKYSRLRAQLADAALMYLAERENIIFTLDWRDFSVYRHGRHGHLRLMPTRRI